MYVYTHKTNTTTAVYGIQQSSLGFGFPGASLDVSSFARESLELLQAEVHHPSNFRTERTLYTSHSLAPTRQHLSGAAFYFMTGNKRANSFVRQKLLTQI